VFAGGDEVIKQSGDFRSWALFGPCAMSDVSPECAPKRTFAHASGFMGRIGVANSLRNCGFSSGIGLLARLER
jgi:hypothetical protein